MIIKNFDNLPIKKKLRYAMLITAYAVLLLTLSIQTTYDLINARSSLVNNLDILAEIIASNSEAALIFEDTNSAKRLLNGFSTTPHIKSAYLTNFKGDKIAFYHMTLDKSLDFTINDITEKTTSFSNTRLHIYRPIILDEQLLGGIYIQSDLSLLYKELWKNIFVALLAILASMIAAYILTYRLQKLLGRPIIELATIISEINKNEVYDRHVHKFHHDEIGQLYDCFNDMLSQIQKRDQRLKQHRENLEIAVAKRTEELDASNTELQISIKETNEAKNEALEAVKAKSMFLANMSHEIRTPMNGILGMLDLLKGTKLNKNQNDFLDIAHSSADSLLQIINDILDFSKIEAGKMEIESIDINPKELTEDICALLANKAREKNIELNCYTDTRLPTLLKGDPVRLRQVLTNLLGNAIKFTEKGSITVRIKQTKQFDDSIVVEFSVEDSGIGIPKNLQNKLFSAFTQADGSTTRKFGGTGLGLTICHQLVTLMGGYIHVHSREGKGSIFSFEINMLVSNTDITGRHILNYDLKGTKALIVDDNAINREILHHYLSAWQINHDEAASALEALEKLHEAATNNHPFDLVYLDMNMPEMDGLTLSSTIDESKAIKQAKRILLSSSCAVSKEVQSQHGISASLTKPYRQSSLLEITIEAIQPHSLQPAISQKKPSTNSLPASIQGARILLVEDNIVNQKVALAILTKAGFNQLDTAENGKAALIKIDQTPYDIILMDCQMPKMSGYETTRRIRKLHSLENHKTIPIIAMTANAMEGDKDKCLASGMDDYLSKPIKADLLIERIIYWLTIKKESDGEKNTIQLQAITSLNLQLLDVKIIDIKTLDMLKDLMEDDFITLLDSYSEDATTLLHDIEKSLQNTDIGVLTRAAHTLKSSSLNVGAQRLAEIAKQIEITSRNHDLIACAPMIPAIKEIMKDTLEILKHYQKNTKS